MITCYERQLKMAPSLGGRLLLELTVESGQIVDAYVAENTTGDAELTACVLRRTRRIRADGLSDVEMSLPFALTPG